MALPLAYQESGPVVRVKMTDKGLHALSADGVQEVVCCSITWYVETFGFCWRNKERLDHHGRSSCCLRKMLPVSVYKDTTGLLSAGPVMRSMNIFESSVVALGAPCLVLENVDRISHSEPSCSSSVILSTVMLEGCSSQYNLYWRLWHLTHVVNRGLL